jgi:hypothetical protein
MYQAKLLQSTNNNRDDATNSSNLGKKMRYKQKTNIHTLCTKLPQNEKLNDLLKVQKIEISPLYNTVEGGCVVVLASESFVQKDQVTKSLQQNISISPSFRIVIS